MIMMMDKKVDLLGFRQKLTRVSFFRFKPWPRRSGFIKYFSTPACLVFLQEYLVPKFHISKANKWFTQNVADYLLTDIWIWARSQKSPDNGCWLFSLKELSKNSWSIPNSGMAEPGGQIIFPILNNLVNIDQNSKWKSRWFHLKQICKLW